MALPFLLSGFKWRSQREGFWKTEQDCGVHPSLQSKVPLKVDDYDEILNKGKKLRLVDFRKDYSGYAGKIGQVSLAVGNPYLGDDRKGVTALVSKF